MRHHEDGVPGFSGELYTDLTPSSLGRDRRFNEALSPPATHFRDFVGAWRQRKGLVRSASIASGQALRQIHHKSRQSLNFHVEIFPPVSISTGPFASSPMGPIVRQRRSHGRSLTESP